MIAVDSRMKPWWAAFALSVIACSPPEGVTVGPGDADQGITGAPGPTGDPGPIDSFGPPADGAAASPYRCGWRVPAPAVAGSAAPMGPMVGDTIANLLLVDQCGDEVPLWDLADGWQVVYLTTAW